MRRRDFIKAVGGISAAWLSAAQAQQRTKVPRIGVLWHAGSEEEEAIYLTALRQGFRDIGYIEGQTLVLEHRFPNEQPERFSMMAAELVALRVDVLVAVATPAALAAQRATTTIPVVFVVVFDPIGSKLVSSLARPDANITGLSHITVEMTAKRLEILKQAVSNLSRVALLTNPNDEVTSRRYKEESQAAAAKLGLTVQPVEVRSSADFDRAFNEITEARLQAVTVGPNGVFFQGREIMAQMALKRRLPLIVYSKETFDAGAPLSYGADQIPIFRRAPVLVDKILKGAKPADLPVELPTKFQFRINLKIAGALGIAVPAELLARADEVID